MGFIVSFCLGRNLNAIYLLDNWRGVAIIHYYHPFTERITKREIIIPKGLCRIMNSGRIYD